MSEETSRSEQDETFFGKPYTQHYDSENQKAGWSETDETFWGKKYTQHYDEEGSTVGTDEVQETLWGDKYVQHYDDDGNKVGYSEEKTDFWGRPYTQHYDEQGNEIGQTEVKETFFGKKYQEHKMKEPTESRGTGGAKNPISGLHWSLQLILSLGIFVAFLFIIVAIISAIVVTIPLWGGMIIVSSIATFVFAEALKKRTDWALSVQQNYKERSIWFGPIVAIGCAALAFIGMAMAGAVFGTIDIVILAIFGGLAFWLSKRASLAIMRWRMADAVKI